MKDLILKYLKAYYMSNYEVLDEETLNELIDLILKVSSSHI